ncbi:IS3 family transposase [Haemophilus influenzae]
MAGLTHSTFFARRKVKPDKNKGLKAAIIQIKAKHPDYGYRRVHACLPGVNHKKIQRLMRELELQVRVRKSKKLTTYRGTIGYIAPNHLERHFTATKPNQKWVTKAKDGSKVYLSPILDLFNNEIVSYTLSYSPNCQGKETAWIMPQWRVSLDDKKRNAFMVGNLIHEKR